MYYIYEDNIVEKFDYKKRNAPTKDGKAYRRSDGSAMLSAVNLEDYPESTLTNQKDPGGYDGYITEYDDAVADWNGQSNT